MYTSDAARRERCRGRARPRCVAEMLERPLECAPAAIDQRSSRRDARAAPARRAAAKLDRALARDVDLREACPRAASRSTTWRYMSRVANSMLA